MSPVLHSARTRSGAMSSSSSDDGDVAAPCTTLAVTAHGDKPADSVVRGGEPVPCPRDRNLRATSSPVLVRATPDHAAFFVAETPLRCSPHKKIDDSQYVPGVQKTPVGEQQRAPVACVSQMICDRGVSPSQQGPAKVLVQKKKKPTPRRDRALSQSGRRTISQPPSKAPSRMTAPELLEELTKSKMDNRDSKKPFHFFATTGKKTKATKTAMRLWTKTTLYTFWRFVEVVETFERILGHQSHLLLQSNNFKFATGVTGQQLVCPANVLDGEVQLYKVPSENSPSRLDQDELITLIMAMQSAEYVGFPGEELMCKVRVIVAWEAARADNDELPRVPDKIMLSGWTKEEVYNLYTFIKANQDFHFVANGGVLEQQCVFVKFPPKDEDLDGNGTSREDADDDSSKSGVSLLVRILPYHIMYYLRVALLCQDRVHGCMQGT